MAWGGGGEAGLAEVVYEPLPAMGREELRRLRATIGQADSEGDTAPPSRRHRSASSVAGVVIGLQDPAVPAIHFGELLEEVDRKLEKLLDGGSVTVVNEEWGRALAGVHSEISALRSQVHDLQASLDRLVIALLG